MFHMTWKLLFVFKVFYFFFLLLFSYTMLFKFTYITRSSLNEATLTNSTENYSDTINSNSSTYKNSKIHNRLLMSRQEFILFIWIFALSVEEFRQVNIKILFVLVKDVSHFINLFSFISKIVWQPHGEKFDYTWKDGIFLICLVVFCLFWDSF